MQLPSELLNITSWKAFQGNLKDITLGHRIVLITKFDDNSFYFLMVTSKIGKAKNRCKKDKASLFEIDVKDWSHLTLPSCIECGKSNLKIVSVDELKKIYKESNLQVLGDVPDIVKRGIKTAICFSKTYTDAEKNMYTKD